MRHTLLSLAAILFYLGAQIIFAMGQLLHLSIPMVAVTPAILVSACALFLIKRMNW